MRCGDDILAISVGHIVVSVNAGPYAPYTIVLIMGDAPDGTPNFRKPPHSLQLEVVAVAGPGLNPDKFKEGLGLRGLGLQGPCELILARCGFPHISGNLSSLLRP